MPNVQSLMDDYEQKTAEQDRQELISKLMRLRHPPRTNRMLVVSKELTQYFVDVIRVITSGRVSGPLLDDCALICAFLHQKPLFQWFYKTHVDNALASEYVLQKSLPPLKALAVGAAGGVLMRAFYALMKSEGFNPLAGVVFTGKADAFVPTVRSRLLFKDSNGWKHGEFTHMLQWLSVCVLKQNRQYIANGRSLSCSVAHVYSQLVDIPIHPVDVKTAENKSPVDWPPEVLGNGRSGAKKEAKTLWDFVVDGFNRKNGLDEPLESLYVTSYRCPSNLSDAIIGGALRSTFIGDYVAARAVKYAQRWQEVAADKDRDKHWGADRRFRAVNPQDDKGRKALSLGPTGRVANGKHSWRMPGWTD